MKFTVSKLFLSVISILVAISLPGYTAQNSKGLTPDSYRIPAKAIGFEENKGQFEGIDKTSASYVLFKVALSNLNIWITRTGITYQQLKYNYKPNSFNSVTTTHTEVKFNSSFESVESYRIDMILKDAHIDPLNVQVSDRLNAEQVNYYHAHCQEGALNVNTYSSVLINNVYPGIDWHLYSLKGNIEYDFIVHPGTDPKLIQMIYEGSGDVKVDLNAISFTTKIGTLSENELLCYQKNKSNSIKANFISSENKELLYAGSGINQNIIERNEGKCFSKLVSFQIGSYNNNENLIVDPKIVWGTYYGGPAPEQSRSVSCDRGGRVFISGVTFDFGFPTQAWGGAYYQPIFAFGLTDCFIMCFSNTGALNWATYYGGNEDEFPNAILCDEYNHVFMTGSNVLSVGITTSTFPLQYLAGAYFASAVFEAANQFLLRFNSATGVREWGTIVADGEGRSMAIDNNRNLYLTGSGSARPAVQRPGAYNDSSFAGGFDITLLRFDSLGALNWATNYGGPTYEEAFDITTDDAGNVYLTGAAQDSFPLFTRASAYNYSYYTGGYGDGYLLSFNPAGALTWSTYLPGTTQTTNVGCDNLGNIYVAGYGDTLMDGPMPTVNLPGAYNQLVYAGGSNDVSIMKFNDGGVMIWSTYFGGTEMELTGNFSCGAEMVIDPCDNVYLSLSTLSTNPNTLYTYTSCNQYVFNGIAMGGYAYMLKLTSNDEISWGTYYGGNGSAAGWGCQLALDDRDNLYAVKSVYEPMVAWPLIDQGNGAFFDSIPDTNEDIHIAKFIPIPPSYILSQVNDSSCACGSATITLTCGEPNYSYVWSNGFQTLNTNSNTSTISGLSAGTYSVTATAACGETTVATFIISNVVTGINNQHFPTWLNLYPNPSHGNITLSSAIDLGKFEIELYDLYGKIVLKEKYLSTSKINLITNLSSGVYFIKVVADMGTYTEKIVVE